MRLFCLRDANRMDQGVYFETKAEAKAARDESEAKLFVTRGPDHWQSVGSDFASPQEKPQE